MDVQAYARDYLKSYKPYKTYWNYEDACVLMGCVRLYQATGDGAYRDFVLGYMDRFVAADGSIPNFNADEYSIDNLCPGKALFFAWEETGQERYRRAIEFHRNRLQKHPRCENGSFWHKAIYPWQVWLDGLYMALPFYTEYERKLNGMQNGRDIVRQFTNVYGLHYDKRAGLFYHGWDEKRAQPWADKETGLSRSFWLRAEGWLLMALAESLEWMDEQVFEQYKAVEDMFKIAVKGLLPYRDAKTGLFFQVIDKPDAPGNYTETSGSAMAAYALMKGARLGALNPETYLPVGRDLFARLAAEKLQTGADGRAHLKDICKVAGLGPGDKRDGSVAYYLSEPKCRDDSKGVGPFLMAWAMYLQTGEE